MMQHIPKHIAQQIEAELRKGNKIIAIKIYKEATNVGLKEAKEAKDAIDAWKFSQKTHGETMTDYKLLDNPFVTNPQDSVSNTEIIEKVYHYLSQNQKLEAIKWVKETQKIGLKEAKDFVDAIEDKHNFQQPVIEVKNPMPISHEIAKPENLPQEGEKINFELSPIVYNTPKKNPDKAQKQLLFLLLFALLVYMLYKVLI